MYISKKIPASALVALFVIAGGTPQTRLVDDSETIQGRASLSKQNAALNSFQVNAEDNVDKIQMNNRNVSASEEKGAKVSIVDSSDTPDNTPGTQKTDNSDETESNDGEKDAIKKKSNNEKKGNSGNSKASESSDTSIASPNPNTASSTPASLSPNEDSSLLNIGDESKNTGTDFEEVKDKPTQKAYLLNDANLKLDSSNTSATIQSLSKGDEVSMIDSTGYLVEVIASNGQAGYVPVTSLTSSKEMVFTDIEKTMYSSRNDMEVLSFPSSTGTVIGKLSKNDTVNVTGKNSEGYDRISYKDSVGYVKEKDLMSKKEIPKPKPTPITTETPQTSIPATSWGGAILSPSAGSVYGPSGKETYYNLDMSGCVNVMRGMGNSDQYWVRNDGVKMLGNYVMCAANLGLHPRGSIVQSSLGPAIVVDTGGFALDNPTQLDIAVAW